MNVRDNEQETCLEVVQIWSNAILHKKTGIYKLFWQNVQFLDEPINTIDLIDDSYGEIKNIDELIHIGSDYKRLLSNCIYGN